MKVNSYQLAVISFVATAFLAVAELTVKLEPDTASRFVYEPFSLLLEVDGDAKTPRVPDGTGYSVTGVFPKAEPGNFFIEIIAEEVGTLTIPPFTVSTSNETAQTPLLRLPVSAPRRAQEMELDVRFSSTLVTVDQPVEMTVTWKSNVPFTRCHELELELPLLRNPAWEAYPLDPSVPEKERIGLPVNAQRVIARNAQTEEGFELGFAYQMIPRGDGVYSSGARLSCTLMESKRSSSQYPSYFDNHFFNRPDKRDRYEQIYLDIPKTELTVQALPEEGRTVRYSGIVGSCAAAASVEPTDTVVGQPMLLTVTLTNLPFGGHIRNLPEATLNGLGSEFKVTPEPMHIETRPNAKAFTYIVRPLRTSVSVLPALTLDRFDPEAKAYRTIRTAPLNLQVAPDGDQTVYQPTRNQTPLIPRAGIRNNRTESRLQMNAYELLETAARNGWLLWLLPPALYLLPLRPWLTHRDRCRIDPAYARAKRALRRFLKNALSNEEAAWNTYLADRLNLHAEAVTADSVAKELRKLDVPEELIGAARNRFTIRDAKHYSPDKQAPGKTPRVHALVRKIEKATRSVVLLLCLTPLFDCDAFTPGQLFDRAVAIRTEKPDEAAPLFTEAALGFEADGQYLNAGNSWFFAGKNGRALANYRSAGSRRPFNKQIRESTDFIRTQRTDSFQGLESGRAASPYLSKVWKKLCRYDPALRFGALTLMYLVAWAAWLTARILGKTIPCKVWFIYGGHAAAIAISLAWSFFQPSEGVVIQAAEARLGPGYAYESAYDSILHEATEFQWLEKREGWIRARLPDETEAWLRETACAKIR